MKTMICKELDGVCDTKITGNTADEMAQNSMSHAMSVNDDVHNNRMREMSEHSKDPEAVKKYTADFKTKFELYQTINIPTT